MINKTFTPKSFFVATALLATILSISSTSAQAFSLPELTQPEPSISITKFTNGEDAAYAPGIFTHEGDGILWSYMISNTGDVPLYNPILHDDNGTPVDQNDDLIVKLCKMGHFPYFVGETRDQDTNCILNVGETWMVDSDEAWGLDSIRSTFDISDDNLAIAGQYGNTATIVANHVRINVATDELTVIETVSANDPSHYFGFVKNQPSLELRNLNLNRSTGTGTLTLENASDGDDVYAIGVEAIRFTVEKQVGKHWVAMDNVDCQVTGSDRFIMWGTQGAQHGINFICKGGNLSQAKRITAHVQIFNRDHIFSHKASAR